MRFSESTNGGQYVDNGRDTGLSLAGIPVIEITPEAREKARREVLSRAESPADAVDLLAMLGILNDDEAEVWEI